MRTRTGAIRPARPSPSGGRPDGWTYRRMDWPQPSGAAPRGSLLFAGGRGDFIEKYLEAYHHWHRRGWNVAAFDWRGQGASQGGGKGAGQTSFDLLIDDLEALLADWRASHSGPHVAVAHSMGGHMLLRTLAERRPALDAAVLVAPMIRVNSAPLSPGLAPWITDFMCLVGPRRRAGVQGAQEARGSRFAPAILSDRLARALCRRALVVGAAAIIPCRRRDLGLDARRLSLVGGGVPARQAGQGRGAGAAARHRARPAGQPRGDPRGGPLAAGCRAQNLSATPATKFCARPIRSATTRSRRSTISSTGTRGDPLRRGDRRRRHGRGEPGRRDRRRGQGPDPRGGGPARLSQHRPLRRFLVGKLWRPADPAVDQRLGRFPRRAAARLCRDALVEPARRHPSRRRVGRGPAGGARRGVRRIRRCRSSRWIGPLWPRPYRASGPAGHAASTSRAAPTSTWRGCTRPISSARAREARSWPARREWSGPSAGRGAGGSQPETGNLKRTSSSTRPAPGPTKWRSRPASGRSASSPIAGRWRSCVSTRRRRPACRWSSMPARASISSPRPAGGSGSARTTRRPARPATARPRKSTSRSRSTGWSRRSTGRVERVERRWAGLRSFAPDRLPVYGFAPGGRGFFWFAGQGGFGIQTAPAAAKLAAALLLGRAPDSLVAGIDPAPYLATRFATLALRTAG